MTFFASVHIEKTKNCAELDYFINLIDSHCHRHFKDSKEEEEKGRGRTKVTINPSIALETYMLRGKCSSGCEKKCLLLKNILIVMFACVCVRAE